MWRDELHDWDKTWADEYEEPEWEPDQQYDDWVTALEERYALRKRHRADYWFREAVRLAKLLKKGDKS